MRNYQYVDPSRATSEWPSLDGVLDSGSDKEDESDACTISNLQYVGRGDWT